VNINTLVSLKRSGGELSKGERAYVMIKVANREPFRLRSTETKTEFLRIMHEVAAQSWQGAINLCGD